MKILVGMVAYVIVFAVVFAASGFLIMDWNPNHWSQDGRFMFVICEFILPTVAFIVAFHSIDDPSLLR